MNLRMVIPVQIAVIGLVGAMYYGYHAVKEPEPGTRHDPAPSTTTAEPTPDMPTTRLVSKKGKFAVGVPEDVKAKKIGFGVTMKSADKVLSVVIAPVESGAISVSSKAFRKGMKASYTKIKVTRTENQVLDGHKAKATYGTARNAKKVIIRFVNIVIKSTPRNYAITAFAAGDSDPLFVLPRVNAIANTFEIIE